MYRVLYRVWRPERFSQVIGQDALVTVLRRQVMSDRVAHAYLMCGSRGTGKTTTARILARASCCAAPTDGEACGTCASCLALAGEGSLDVWELDAASNNGVDEVRDLREKIKYPPAIGRRRVIIIDEVHMLSAGAFNALLKTLEEPPGHALFILCTTEPQRLPVTILSRCQRFDFRRIPSELIAEALAGVAAELGLTADARALAMLARAAAGAMRDALNLLDVAVGFGGGELTPEIAREVLGVPDDDFFAEMTDALIDHDAGRMLSAADAWLRGGRDAVVLLRALAGRMRDILIARQTGGAADILERAPEEIALLAAQAARAPIDTWLRWLETFARAESDLRYAASPRVLLDLCILRAAHPEAPGETPALEERIARLEALLERGTPSAPREEISTEALPRARSAVSAPVARKEPGPAVPASDAETLWKGLLTKVRAAPAGMGRYVLLSRGTPVSWDGSVLTVRFSEKDRSAYDVVSGEASRAALEICLRETAGASAGVSILLEGGAPADAGPGPSLLEQAARVFDRGIIVVEEGDG